MIVRTLDDIKARGGYREKPGVWTSSRYLLRNDGVGFTVTQTAVAAGQTQRMRYDNHVEANLVVAGEGEVTDLATGEAYALEAGSMYALDKHDPHELRAITDMQIVCVFSPALVGQETHDENGSYPLLEDDA
ncbi:MAG: L-ectoine synthase [Chromatiales bacterium]|nr:L-ectoine synthase [Chromatiales bacterium]